MKESPYYIREKALTRNISSLFIRIVYIMCVKKL